MGLGEFHGIGPDGAGPSRGPDEAGPSRGPAQQRPGTTRATQTTTGHRGADTAREENNVDFVGGPWRWGKPSGRAWALSGRLANTGDGWAIA